jgi:hypothetical protein
MRTAAFFGVLLDAAAPCKSGGSAFTSREPSAATGAITSGAISHQRSMSQRASDAIDRAGEQTTAPIAALPHRYNPEPGFAPRHAADRIQSRFL